MTSPRGSLLVSIFTGDKRNVKRRDREVYLKHDKYRRWQLVYEAPTPSHVSAHYQSAVSSAEAEGIRQGHVDFHRTGCKRNVIQVTIRIRCDEINGWRRYLI